MNYKLVVTDQATQDLRQQANYILVTRFWILDLRYFDKLSTSFRLISSLKKRLEQRIFFFFSP